MVQCPQTHLGHCYGHSLNACEPRGLEVSFNGTLDSGWLPTSLVPQAGAGSRVLLIGVGSEVRSEVWVTSGL